MLDRFWQPYDTDNLLGALVIVGAAFALLVIWLADCDRNRTKQ